MSNLGRPGIGGEGFPPEPESKIVLHSPRLPGFGRAIVGFLLVCLLLPVSVRAEEQPAEPRWSGNVNLFFGMKFLDEKDWKPVDKQMQAGILFDVRHRALPFNIAFDLLYSRDEADFDVAVLGIDSMEVEVEGETLEMDLGVRKIWEGPREVRPFLGGGLAVIRAEIEAKGGGGSVSDRDTALGIWLDVGAYVTLGERWNLGVDGRWSWAKADLMGVENADVGGWHLGALLGAHF